MAGRSKIRILPSSDGCELGRSLSGGLRLVQTVVNSADRPALSKAWEAALLDGVRRSLTRRRQRFCGQSAEQPAVPKGRFGDGGRLHYP